MHAGYGVIFILIRIGRYIYINLHQNSVVSVHQVLSLEGHSRIVMTNELL